MNRPPQHILPRHRSIMRLLLRGLTLPEIAETMNYRVSALKYLVSSQLFKAELEKLQVQADAAIVTEQLNVRAKIAELSQKSITELEALLQSAATADKLRADVAWDILDRAGYKANDTNNQPAEQPEDNYATALQAAYNKRKAIKQLTADPATESSTPALSTDLEPKQLVAS